MLVPFIWTVSTSFKQQSGLMTATPEFIPDPGSLDAYQTLSTATLTMGNSNSGKVVTEVKQQLTATTRAMGLAQKLDHPSAPVA